MLLDKVKLICKIFLCVLAINIIQANDENLVQNKDPKKAFYFSLIPGMGQLYNGKLIKSTMIISLEISAYFSWKNNLEKYNEYDGNSFPLKRHRYLEKRNKYAWWIGIIYVYAMIDAVVDAHLNSFDTLMESPLNQKQKEGETNE